MISQTCGRKTAAWASAVAPSMPNGKYENAATPLIAATTPPPHLTTGWGPDYTNRK